MAAIGSGCHGFESFSAGWQHLAGWSLELHLRLVRQNISG
jgi:hypothetical protein